MIKTIFTNINLYFAVIILIANNIMNTGKNQLIINIIAGVCLILILGSSIIKYKSLNNKEINERE